MRGSELLWAVWSIGAFASACGGTQARPPEAAAPAVEVANDAAAPSLTPASESGAAPASDAAPPVPSPAAEETAGSVVIGEIAAAKSFDPKSTLEGLRPNLLACYRKARGSNASLHGKVTLRVQVNEAGAVTGVDAVPGGPAADPALVACIRDDFKDNAHFQKPGGSATVLAPLVFRR